MPSETSRISSKVVDALVVFDLGDDLGRVRAVIVEELADLHHVLLAADEGRRHQVHVLLDAKEQVLLVLLPQDRHVQVHVRDVDALVVGHLAAVDDAADDLRIRGALHLQHDLAVVDQDGIARMHRCRQTCKGLLDDLRRAEIPQADLRALGVQHDGQRHAHLLPQLLEQRDGARVVLVIPVGEVEPGHVHARLHHLPERFHVPARRADSAYDLGLSHSGTPFKQVGG